MIACLKFGGGLFNLLTYTSQYLVELLLLVTGTENLYVQIKIPEPEQKHSTLVSYAGERSDVIVINNNTC